MVPEDCGFEGKVDFVINGRFQEEARKARMSRTKRRHDPGSSWAAAGWVST